MLFIQSNDVLLLMCVLNYRKKASSRSPRHQTAVPNAEKTRLDDSRYYKLLRIIVSNYLKFFEPMLALHQQYNNKTWLKFVAS